MQKLVAMSTATLTDSSFQLQPRLTQLGNVASSSAVTPSAGVHRGVAIAVDNFVTRLRQLFVHARLLDGPHVHRPLPLSVSSHTWLRTHRNNLAGQTPVLHFG